MKVIDDDFAVGQGWQNIVTNHEYDYDDGSVITPHGIVWATAQGDDQHRYASWLRFVYGGRYYSRRFNGKRYTARGLMLKAKQFAAEVAARGEED